MTPAMLAHIESSMTLHELRDERRMQQQLTQTGRIKDVEDLLKVSNSTVHRLKDQWILGVHYWKVGRNVVFNLALIDNWQQNQHDPVAHQRAIAEWQAGQLGNKRKRR